MMRTRNRVCAFYGGVIFEFDSTYADYVSVEHKRFMRFDLDPTRQRKQTLATVDIATVTEETGGDDSLESRAFLLDESDECSISIEGKLFSARVSQLTNTRYEVGLDLAYPRAFSDALTALCGCLVERGGGVVMHATTVATDRGAISFVGPSGAGKTTAASHMQHCTWVSKDRVSIYPICEVERETTYDAAGDAPRHKWWAAGMAGGDELPLSPHAPGAVPLCGILRVEKRDKTKVTAFDATRRIAHIRENVQSLAHDPLTHQAALKRSVEIAEAVQVAELGFHIGGDVPGEIERWQSSIEEQSSGI